MRHEIALRRLHLRSEMLKNRDLIFRSQGPQGMAGAGEMNSLMELVRHNLLLAPGTCAPSLELVWHTQQALEPRTPLSRDRRTPPRELVRRTLLAMARCRPRQVQVQRTLLEMARCAPRCRCSEHCWCWPDVLHDAGAGSSHPAGTGAKLPKTRASAAHAPRASVSFSATGAGVT